MVQSLTARVETLERTDTAPVEQARVVERDAIIQQEYYSVFEVCILLGLPERATRKLIADGALPARRIAGHVCIPRDEFRATLRDLPEAYPVEARPRAPREKT